MGIKIITLFKLQPGIDDGQFRRYWREDYLPSVLSLPEAEDAIDRIDFNHSVPLTIREDMQMPVPEWAGVSEIWLDSETAGLALLSALDAPAFQSKHGAVFCQTVSMPCREMELWNDGLETPTVKLMAFFLPAATMTRTESQHYWTHDHVRAGAELTDPRKYAPRYVQNHVLADHHNDNPRLDFAGCPELWFYSRESAVALFTEPGEENMAKLAEDEAVFSDSAKSVALVTDQETVYRS